MFKYLLAGLFMFVTASAFAAPYPMGTVVGVSTLCSKSEPWEETIRHIKEGNPEIGLAIFNENKDCFVLPQRIPGEVVGYSEDSVEYLGGIYRIYKVKVTSVRGEVKYFWNIIKDPMDE
jgi:hypothetical protein